MEDVTAKVLELTLTALGLLATYGLTRLNKWLKTRAETEQQRNALDRLTSAVRSAVLDMQQTTVKQLREASKDGRLTAEERTVVKNQAVDHAFALLGPKGLSQVKQIFDGDMDVLVRAKVEEAVVDAKPLAKGPPAG